MSVNLPRSEGFFHMMPHRISSATMTLFCLGLCATSYAQHGGGRPNSGAGGSKQQAPYTIPVTVRRVVLDVVVKDSHGNPVKGLTRSDFSVFEQ
jgi:hypothetical protein